MPAAYVPVAQDERKMRYINWLVTLPEERQPASERELARQLDVHAKTLYQWRQDRDFREVWADAAAITYGDNDHRLAVIDALYRVAVDEGNPRQVQAAKAYLDVTRQIRPTGDALSGAKAIGMLSDAELEILVARGLAEIRADQQQQSHPVIEIEVGGNGHGDT